MKKAISILLVLVMMFSLCACGQSTPAAETEPKATSISIGQKTTVGEYAFTVDSVKFDGGYTINGTPWSAGNDEDFCIVTLTVFNEGRKALSIYSKPSLTLNYDNGYDTHGFRPSWEYTTTGSYMVPGDISPQEKRTMVLLAEVPELQAEDTASSMVLDIKFQDVQFTLKVR